MKKKNILLLIILLVIGFASVSTTLILNGTLDIGFNNKDFDVVFTSANISNDFGQSVQDSVKSRLTISDPLSIEDNGKSFSFTTNLLSVVGETNIVNYTIKNRSKNYDANVTINCGVDESANALLEYISIEQSITSPFTLASGEEKRGTITIELTKAYTGEDDDIEYKCTLVATPTERDTLGEGERVPYTDPILNGADPEGIYLNMNDQEENLGDPDMVSDNSKSRMAIISNLAKVLIPVTISDDGEVTYADIYEKWYNYSKKEWANAVILNAGVTHEVGDIIPESDIESYFVWIPRYKYQIFDEGNYTEAIESKPTESIAHTINIEFESKDTAPSTGAKKDTWLTHPAFTSLETDRKKVNGIWVGKFETSKTENSIQIKPGVSSWRNETVKTFFTESLSYNRVLDSHMMKNTEWGAVAYLSHSVYGINDEVRINNNSNYLTGYSSTDEASQLSTPGIYGTDSTKTLPYNTATGYKASTTGNITGIYDMNGGAGEYMAAYLSSSQDMSGFQTEDFTNYSKYLDFYPSNSVSTPFNNRNLGDATGEIGPFYLYEDDDKAKRYHNNWYSDIAHFIDNNYPWFNRGGSYNRGILSGQFNFNKYTGNADINLGSRLVLTPTYQNADSLLQ